MGGGRQSYPGPLAVGTLGSVIHCCSGQAEMNHNILSPQWKREEREQEARESERPVFPQLNTCFHRSGDGFRGMNGHDLVIFWMDDFKCLLEGSLMRQPLQATAQSGSLQDRSSRCLSEAVKALRAEIPDAAISVSMIPTGTSSLPPFQTLIRHHVIRQGRRGREGETVES